MSRPILTDRQRQVFNYVRRMIRKNAIPPTVREIQEYFNFASPRAITDHLNALERKGYIEREAGKSRSISIPEDVRGIPIIGKAAAGHPVLAEENISDTLDVETMFSDDQDNLYAVSVQGDSMIESGILDGDYVIVRKGANFENGAVALAFVEGEATIKHIFKTKTGFRLKPANVKYTEVKVDKNKVADFSIMGPVVGVVRSM